MKEYTIYHNPRCSKSRQALKYLEEAGKSFEVIEYLKAIPSAAEMDTLLKQLDLTPEALLRKGETDYKERYKGKSLSREEWIDAMRAFPKLIERPIVVRNNKAVIARPAEKISDLD